MSNTYTYFVDTLGYGNDEATSVGSQRFGLVNQTNPAWVLTFIRWNIRDTLRDPNDSSTVVRNPLIVESDCLFIETVQDKGILTPSMSCTLVMTDINYETAVAPGDFVFVNILNWQEDARRVARQAYSLQPINGINDGFKGIYKVQSVRKRLSSDPITGTKTVLFTITGFAFTEFNNHIYFNPYLIDPKDQDNFPLFSSLIGLDFNSLVNKKTIFYIQDIIAMLIQSFIGTGIMEKEIQLGVSRPIVSSNNTHFLMPTKVGKLLGISSSSSNLSAKDIYLFLFGLQTYAPGLNTTLSAGMNPIIGGKPFGSNFYYTNNVCEGVCQLNPSYWNDVPAWSILNQYTNSPLNELYTCFRVSPTAYSNNVGNTINISSSATGGGTSLNGTQNASVMPTMVFRQKPFTNPDYPLPRQGNSPGSQAISSGKTTGFLTVPRWKIDPALVFSMDIGRDESARFNFAQYFGRSTFTKDGADVSAEIAQHNYVFDVGDVQRSGLRPYIVNTQFDEIIQNKTDYRSPIWAQIVGDFVMGGHLKMNGTMVMAGIVQPIAVGDNFELDNIVYHIERIQHTAQISPLNGIVSFRTTLSLSQGISASGTSAGTKYAEMNNTNAYLERDSDYQYDKILPGVSESQTSINRTSQSPDPSVTTLNGTRNAKFKQPSKPNNGNGNNQE